MISAQEQAAFSPEASLPLLSRFVSRRTGLFKEPMPCFLSEELPDIFVFNSQGLASGAALSETEALVCTIGESIERHSSMTFQPEGEVVCSYRELEGEAVHPSRFALFSESQYLREKFPFKPFTEDTVVRWTTGYSLTEKREVKIPSCLTYMSYRLGKGEEAIGGSSSNGLSCHFIREKAILKSLYEVIERDAFFTMWFNRLSMPRLSIEGVEWLEKVFAEKLGKPGIEYDFIDLTNDIGVPTVSCLVKMKQAGRTLTGVGAASNLDPARALLKALVEASHALVWADSQMTRSDWAFDPTFANIRDFPDHVRLYCETEMLPELDFMTASDKLSSVSALANRSTGSLKEDIDICVEALRSCGMEAILVDMTPGDVEDAGLSIIKIVVPEAVGINADYRYRLLGGNRLYETPRVLGYTKTRTREEDLNPAPHPFP